MAAARVLHKLVNWLITDRHVRINVTLRFLTLRYVTWGWKTRITQVIIGTNVSAWILVKSRTFWAFVLTTYNAYFILPIVFVNLVSNKQELLCYVQQNIVSFGICVLQGSGVTRLKCGEIYDMFLANFMTSTTVKKKKISCQSYEWMYSGTVFLR